MYIDSGSPSAFRIVVIGLTEAYTLYDQMDLETKLGLKVLSEQGFQCIGNVSGMLCSCRNIILCDIDLEML